MTRTRSKTLRLSLVVAMVAGAAGSAVAATASPRHPASSAQPAATHSAWSAKGSAHQVYVTGLKPGEKVQLLNHSGKVVATQGATQLGGLLFRGIKPGSGYHVRRVSTGAKSGAITVHTNAAKPWDAKVYKQSIPDHGYGYLTTRDGTKLAYTVHPPSQPAGLGTPPVFLPGGPDYAPPYPTLIEYSGYGYARPDGPVNGIAVLANLMGFAVVDVNMRGTGCSSGAFDFFEPLQSLDGYDVIETIAHQSWVRGHKVGMMGISYGGISQLFTARLHPPSLAAISPLSVIDATATTLYPGGILNTGFAVAWANERQHEAKPSGPDGGQPYAADQIKSGDEVCKQNQVLHASAADLNAKIAANSHYRPKVADQLDPVTFVHKIKVPVFMACQYEDEQTGGHCPTLAEHMTGTKKKWFTFTNGAHIDSLDPETYNRWYDFLNIYVAKQAPSENASVTQGAAPVIYQQAMGLPMDDHVTLPPDPIQSMPTLSAAQTAFEKLKSIRVLFDNGAGTAPPGGSNEPGNPYPGFEQSFTKVPVPGTTAHYFYLGPSGTLNSKPPAVQGINGYRSNAKALTLSDYGQNTGGGGLWGNASQWDWKWKNNPSGTAVSYVTPPLKADTTVVGAGAVHLWVRSSTPDVDLLTTVSEVDPNGKESFVQSGYLRASERKMSTGSHTIFAKKSSLLEPVPSFTSKDARPMPDNRFVKVVVPLYYEGHAYRKGTRIRITIASPNGTQPIWSFDYTQPQSVGRVAIAFSKSMPSSLILPVVPSVSVPTDTPPCHSLRNEPCRAYKPMVNQKIVS